MKASASWRILVVGVLFVGVILFVLVDPFGFCVRDMEKENILSQIGATETQLDAVHGWIVHHADGQTNLSFVDVQDILAKYQRSQSGDILSWFPDKHLKLRVNPDAGKWAAPGTSFHEIAVCAPGSLLDEEGKTQFYAAVRFDGTRVRLSVLPDWEPVTLLDKEPPQAENNDRNRK